MSDSGFTGIISALTFLAPLSLAERPRVYEPTEEDVENVRLGMEELGGGGSEDEEEEDEEEEEEEEEIDAEGDPYIVIPEGAEEDSDAEEDLTILPTDSIILVGKTEDELSHLEVHVYDNKQNHHYVHHDIMLPSFPLAFTHIHTGKQALLAVSTFSPEIELWDLDILETPLPKLTLGKRNAKKGTKDDTSHTDAVLAMAWHKNAPHVLLSASADHTIKMWNLVAEEPQHAVASFNHHTDKVACIDWNPNQVGQFLSAGYDGKIFLVDATNENKEEAIIRKWKVSSDVECMKWDPHHPGRFAVSLENGEVVFYHIEHKKALFTLAAHTSPCTSFDFHPLFANLFATTSVDSSVKVWDYTIGDKTTVDCITTKDYVDLGNLFHVAFNPANKFILAFGGSGGELGIWDLGENLDMRARLNRLEKEKKAETDTTNTAE